MPKHTVDLILGMGLQQLEISRPFCLTQSINNLIVEILVTAGYHQGEFFHGEEAGIQFLSGQFAHVGELLEQQEQERFQCFRCQFLVLDEQHVAEHADGGHQFDDVLRLVAFFYAQSVQVAEFRS